MIDILEREREELSFIDFQCLLYEMYKNGDIDEATYFSMSEDI